VQTDVAGDVMRLDDAERAFDSTQHAVFDVDLKVYATAPLPGALDTALEYLTQDLHMRMPLRELFAADLPKTLAPLRHTARWVDSETIAGVATDYVFLPGNGADLQEAEPSMTRAC
jgi:hypothetical protein